MAPQRPDTRRRLLLASAAVVAAGALPTLRAADAPRVIAVHARRFTYSPNTIQLKRGEPVVLELTTEDTMMGFNAPDFGVRADIPLGAVVRVPLTPEKAGRFTFLCDVFCGSGHEEMSGTLVVDG